MLLAFFFSPTHPSQIRSGSMHLIQHYSINTNRSEQRRPADSTEMLSVQDCRMRESRRPRRLNEELCRYKGEMTSVEHDQEMFRMKCQRSVHCTSVCMCVQIKKHMQQSFFTGFLHTQFCSTCALFTKEKKTIINLFLYILQDHNVLVFLYQQISVLYKIIWC